MLQLPTEGDGSAFKSNHFQSCNWSISKPAPSAGLIIDQLELYYNSITRQNNTGNRPTPLGGVSFWYQCREFANISIIIYCTFLVKNKHITASQDLYLCENIWRKKNEEKTIELIFVCCIFGVSVIISGRWLLAGWCVSNDRRTQNDNQCQKSILKWIDSVSQMPTIQIIQKYITYHIQIYLHNKKSKLQSDISLHIYSLIKCGLH